MTNAEIVKTKIVETNATQHRLLSGSVHGNEIERRTDLAITRNFVT